MNHSDVSYVRDISVVQLIAENMQRHAAAIAVTDGERSLAYYELDAASNQLANYLRAHRVGPNVIVGVCMHRTIEMIIALFGIIKAGGAYVPIDPIFPPDRIAFIVEDAGVNIMLTQTSLEVLLPAACCLQLDSCMDTDWEKVVAQQVATMEPFEQAIAPTDLAYIIYTSGSTGKPKGVQIEHRALVHLCIWYNSYFALTSGDRVTHLSGLAFDASIMEVWPPLCAGSCICLVTNEETRANPSIANGICFA